MGLRIKGASGLGQRTSTIIAAFALIAQPLLVLNIPAVFAVGATTLHVAVGGIDSDDCSFAKPCATIQHAIGQASRGDIVQVGPGTFAGDITLDKDVSLVGNGNDGEHATIVESTTSNNAITIQSHLAKRSNITIKNFVLNDMLMVTSNTGANHPGYDTRNLTLENLTVNAHGYYGILLQSIDRVNLTSIIVDNASYGIEMNGVSNAHVASSLVKNSTVGVNIQSIPDYGANNTIKFIGTDFSNNGQAIKAVGARNVTIADGDISGGTSAVSFKDVTHSSIANMQINGHESASSLAVIELIGTASHIDIVNNTFNDLLGAESRSTGGTAQAILVGDTGQSGNLRFINISNNSFRNIKGERGGYALMVNRPMSMESGAQLKFTNNTVDGIHGKSWMAGIGLDENTPNAEITGNTFSNLTTDDGTPIAINVNHREGNTSDPTSMTIKQNNFNTPGQIGVNYDWAPGTAPSLNKHLDASENFWGTPAGPGKAGGASVGTFTKYSNWLCGPAPSSETSSGESKGCVQPIIEAVTPGKGAAIKGVQRVYVTVKNPEVVSGGFLQLNKALDTGSPLNANRTNYPLKRDGDQWYAEVDTKNIVALSGGGHQGDGKYLFQIEVHHKYGHSTSTPWGYYGAGVGSWHKSEYFFIVDNKMPSMDNLKFYVKDSGGNYVEKRYVKPGDEVRVEVDAIDNGSGIDHVEFRIRASVGGGYVTARTYVSAPVSGNTYQFDFTVPSDGKYHDTHQTITEALDGLTFWARADDKAGNYGNGLNTNALEGRFTYDSTAPVLNIEDIPDSTNSTPTIKGTTTDSADVVVTVDGQDYIASPDAHGNWQVEVGPLSVGTYAVVANSVDAAGNSAAEVTNQLSIIAVQGSETTSRPGKSSAFSASPTLPITPPAADPSSFLDFLNRDVIGYNSSRGNNAAPDDRRENGVANRAPNANSHVLGTQDDSARTSTTEDKPQCGKIFGVCWYWPVAGAVGLVVVAYIVRLLRGGRGEDQPA